MDILDIEQRLVSGEELKVKYRYPLEADGRGGPHHGVRTDRLLNVSPDLNRFYAKFRGSAPIWITEDEVIEVTPDDGEYEDFPPE